MDREEMRQAVQSYENLKTLRDTIANDETISVGAKETLSLMIDESLTMWKPTINEMREELGMRRLR